MADDIQYKQLAISLNSARKISDQTLLSEFGRDALEEAKILEQEMQRQLVQQRKQAMYAAQIQNDVQAINARGQAKLQQAMAGQQASPQEAPAGQGPQGSQGQGEEGDQNQVIQAYAEKLSKMEPEKRAKMLTQLRDKNPQVAALIESAMQALSAGPQAGSTDMRPSPTQKPPRRASKAM